VVERDSRRLYYMRAGARRSIGRDIPHETGVATLSCRLLLPHDRRTDHGRLEPGVLRDAILCCPASWRALNASDTWS